MMVLKDLTKAVSVALYKYFYFRTCYTVDWYSLWDYFSQLNYNIRCLCISFQ